MRRSNALVGGGDGRFVGGAGITERAIPALLVHAVGVPRAGWTVLKSAHRSALSLTDGRVVERGGERVVETTLHSVNII